MNNWKNILDEKSSDYRPLTFWSWNNKLDNERLKQQIHELKESGFGGFFMHARYGLKTEYMSDEWFDAVNCCIHEAKKQGLTAWCYDENGYPSGFAGMELLKKPDYLARYITVNKTENSTAEPLCVFGISDDNKPVFNCTKNYNGKVYEIYENLSPANVDVFNKNVVNDFLNLTHEKYYEKFGEHFGTLISGFFTDEPQYFRYGTPYSSTLAKEYEKRYNENIIEILPFLFFELDGYKEKRWKYYKLANELYTEIFAKTIYEWCDSHNVQFTGHTIEESLLYGQMWCSAGVMPFYEYEHIPGCDWLGRNPKNQLNPKQVGSVAQQLGKAKTLTESFAATGWDATPRELKRLVDFQFANGINLLCTHLTPYSMEGGRKYDHPEHFSKVNPWFDKFSDLSKYVKNLGCMMGESRELANVGVIHPIHSAYLTYNREDDYDSIKKLEDEFNNLLIKLEKYNIPYHLIDESLLAKYGSVKSDKLIVGKCEYDKIAISSMEQIDESTAHFLKEYISNGGKIHLFGDKPSYVSGKKGNLDYLDSNIKFSDLISDTYSICDFNTDISSVYRKSDCGDFLFVFNKGNKKQTVKYKIKATGACEFDLLSETYNPLCFENAENGYISIPLTLESCESKLIMTGDYQSVKPKEYPNLIETKDVKISFQNKNILLLDKAQLSYDGETFFEELPIEGINDMLLKKHYSGNIYLKYQFFAKSKVGNITVEAEKMNCTYRTFNGKEIKFDGEGIFDPDFVTANIDNDLIIGKNELVFCVNYHQNNHIYEVLDNVTPISESLINCLVYDTEIAPITLYGDFTLQGKNGYYDEKENVYCYSAPFEINKKAEVIDGSITCDGYPFYSGDVKYNFKVNANKNISCMLKFTERFCTAHVKWNDFESDLVLTDSIIIPSKYVKEENLVEITVTTSNRNRLGPHHCIEEREPYAVGIDLFNMCGSWENGKSDLYNEEYAFVEQKIDVAVFQECENK